MGTQRAEEGLDIAGDRLHHPTGRAARRGRGNARRAVAVVVAGVIVAGPMSALGTAGSEPLSCSISGRITPHAADWYSIDAPHFPVGPQTVSAYAVDPMDRDHLYVTNGASVMRSSDGGCRWDVAYALADSSAAGPGLNAANARIRGIDVSAGAVVYVSIQQSSPVGPRARALVSSDHGATWQPADGPGLAATIGVLRDFDASATNRTSAYALVDVENGELPGGLSLGVGQVLFATSNAGATWDVRALFANDTRVSPPGGAGVVVATGEELDRVEAHPRNPGEVWVYGRAGVFVSDGLGARDLGLGATGVLDISRDGRLVLVYGRDSPDAYMSTDGGASFEKFNARATISSAAAAAANPPFAAVGALGNAYFQMGRTLVDISPYDGRPLSDLQVAAPPGYRFPLVYGHTTYSIEVKAIPKAVRFDDIEEIKTGALQPGPAHKPGVLRPRRERIVLRPGRARTIPYSLRLRSSATPVDVYFLIDVSQSMQGTINGVRAAMQSIVDRLGRAGLDALFGVGAFRSFRDAPAYQRVRDIGPPDDELRRALDSLVARGGDDETQMAALYESVTGDGRYGVPPGLNMHFRKPALKIAILVTDEPISQGGLHPGIATVVDALVDADVKQVGLAIQEGALIGPDDYDNPGQPASELQKVARGSNALAPEGGVDCDGNPGIEISEGGPLVCMVSPGRSSDAEVMANVIVQVVEAVEDVHDLKPAVVSSSATGDVVDSVTPAVFPGRDLKRPHSLSFDVTVRCPDVRARTIFPLTVGVDATRRRLADASLVLVCVPRATPAEEQAPPVAPVFSALVPPAAVVPPAPRPPEPVPEPNPYPNPNPQANPQAQAGLAMQDQKEPQFAFVYQSGANEHAAYRPARDDLDMSTPRRRPGAPPALFVVATGALTSLFAYVMALERTRGAPAVNVARIRRRASRRARRRGV